MLTKIYRLKVIQLVIMLLVSIILITIVVVSLDQYGNQYGDVEVSRIKETVEKYAIQCYATEGAYPPSVNYLVEHYGLVLDEEKYIYEYQPVAENIKPIIQIFVRIGYKEK